MSDDDLPEFYIEAAQVVVGMNPFPSAAETGIAIEAVRRTILQARSKAFEEAAKIADCGCNNPGCERDEIAQAIRQHSQKGRDNG